MGFMYSSDGMKVQRVLVKPNLSKLLLTKTCCTFIPSGEYIKPIPKYFDTAASGTTIFKNYPLKKTVFVQKVKNRLTKTFLAAKCATFLQVKDQIKFL